MAKYHPSTPERFGSLEDVRTWASAFFEWYNHEHHHMGLGLLTPAMVHDGRADQVLLHESRCSQQPTRHIQNALCEGSPSHSDHQRQPGSTHHSRESRTKRCFHPLAE